MTDREVDDSMRREMNSLVAAYVLDALPADERATFEAYLDGSPEAARQVDQLYATAALLGSVDAAPPPAQLRERVLAAAARTRQLAPIARRPADDIPPDDIPSDGFAPASSAAGSSAPGGSAVDRSQVGSQVEGNAGGARATRGERLTARVAAAFALAAILVLGVVVGVQANRLSDARRQATQAQEASALSAITRQADMRTETSRVQSGGKATVLVSASAGRGVVLLVGVPKLATDKTYQLWLIPASGRPRSVTTFLTDDTTASVDFDGVQQGDSVGVTVEPAGGSQTGLPTTTPLLNLQVA